MAEYVLHCFAQSGNAYKAALTLELGQADWQPVFVDFMNGETRTEAFRKLNPMGEVPVLQHRDVTLTQSGVMLDYLSRRLGRFGPTSETEAREILRWILWDNHKLTSYMATWRFITNYMPIDRREPAVIAFLETRARTALGILDGHLSGRDWIVGSGPTTADFSCAGYMFYADEYPIDWDADYPGVVAWRQRIAALPGWRHPYEMMPGHPVPEREG